MLMVSRFIVLSVANLNPVQEPDAQFTKAVDARPGVCGPDDRAAG
jgi:hypothetical protein